MDASPEGADAMTATARKYYTLCIWIEGDDANDPGCWADEFGSYSRREVQQDREFGHSHRPRGHTAIISHAESEGAMIAARDALAKPKGRNA
jgi:hypothetical protein